MVYDASAMVSVVESNPPELEMSDGYVRRLPDAGGSVAVGRGVGASVVGGSVAEGTEDG
jgi:hypothetical protein